MPKIPLGDSSRYRMNPGVSAYEAPLSLLLYTVTMTEGWSEEQMERTFSVKFSSSKDQKKAEKCLQNIHPCISDLRCLNASS